MAYPGSQDPIAPLEQWFRTVQEMFRTRIVTVETTTFTDSQTYIPLDGLEITMDYPPSGIVKVEMFLRANSDTVGGGALLGFEIRDNDENGTVRVEPDTRQSAWVNDVRTASTANVSAYVGGVEGLPTSGTMFVRGMIRSNPSGTTASFQGESLVVTPSP